MRPRLQVKKIRIYIYIYREREREGGGGGGGEEGESNIHNSVHGSMTYPLA